MTGKTGQQIFFESLLKMAGFKDPAVFTQEMYNAINAIKYMDEALKSIDARLAAIERALHVVKAEEVSANAEPKQLTNGAANG